MVSRPSMRTLRARPASAAEAGPAQASAQHHGRPRRSGAIIRIVMILPLLAFLAVFAVYPLIELVRTSVSNVHVTNGVFTYSPAGTANFAQIRTDGTFWYSAGITLIFIAITVAGTVMLGTFLALILDKSVVLTGFARNVLLWPAVITPVVVSVIWYMVLSPDVGVLNKVLASLGLGPQGWLGEPLGAMASIIILDIWHWTPLVFILV